MTFGEKGGQRRKNARLRRKSAVVRLPWLNLFHLLLTIQVCLANFFDAEVKDETLFNEIIIVLFN